MSCGGRGVGNLILPGYINLFSIGMNAYFRLIISQKYIKTAIQNFSLATRETRNQISRPGSIEHRNVEM